MSIQTDYVGGINLAFFEEGSGAPTFVFVHGGGCTHSDWAYQLDALGTSHRAIALDLPGHGVSGSEPGLSVERIADVVSEFVKTNVHGSVILVGHSFGCRVVLAAGQDIGARLVGIVLVDGSNVRGWDSRSSVEAVQALIRERGAKKFLRDSFNEMFVEKSDVRLRSAIVERAQGWAAEAAESVLLSTIRWDIDKARDVIATVAAPMLLLQSTYVGPDFKRRSLLLGMTTPWTELVQSLAPTAQLKIIEGTGHFPHLERPEAVTAALREFVDELCPSARSQFGGEQRWLRPDTASRPP